MWFTVPFYFYVCWCKTNSLEFCFPAVKECIVIPLSSHPLPSLPCPAQIKLPLQHESLVNALLNTTALFFSAFQFFLPSSSMKHSLLLGMWCLASTVYDFENAVQVPKNYYYLNIVNMNVLAYGRTKTVLNQRNSTCNGCVLQFSS